MQLLSPRLTSTVSARRMELHNAPPTVAHSRVITGVATAMAAALVSVLIAAESPSNTTPADCDLPLPCAFSVADADVAMLSRDRSVCVVVVGASQAVFVPTADAAIVESATAGF